MDGIKQLDDESVQSIITSPPYWQKRDYGTNEQWGLEEDYHDYLRHLFGLFSECKRVLKSTGLLWIVIADTYSGNKKGITDSKLQYFSSDNIRKTITNIPRKSLMMLPERLVLDLIEDGWILRNKVIWQKPNVMPESIKDRFTIDFEQIYMFSKSPKYLFHQQKEPAITTSDYEMAKGLFLARERNKQNINPRGSKGIISSQNSGRKKQDNAGNPTYTGFNDRYSPAFDGMRNVRCVWNIPTAREANIDHFAMFPEELAERMLLSSSDIGDTVLDPFMGAATTALVARKNNRNFIGFEISKEYCDIAEKRIEPYMNQMSIYDLK